MKLDMVYISLFPFVMDDVMTAECRSRACDVLETLEKTCCGAADICDKSCVLYFWKEEKHGLFQGQYVSLLAERISGSRCILVFPSLYDISRNTREAVGILRELSSDSRIRDIFISDISLSKPFMEYGIDLHRIYGADSPDRVRLRMPDAVLKRADACRSRGLSFGDIMLTLHVSRSQVRNYRNRIGVTYVDKGIPHPEEQERAELMEENRVLLDRTFSEMFECRTFTVE